MDNEKSCNPIMGTPTAEKSKIEILAERLLNDSPAWWKAIKEDSDIYIEIRKTYIDAYYNGGAIMKELKWSEKNGYQARIHDKYINEDGKNSYSKCPLELLPEKLPEIKKRIAEFYAADSEKGIQAQLRLQANNLYIDSEYQDAVETKSGEKKPIRIDLVYLDYTSKKIIFQELKRIEDSRLLKKGEDINSRELNEIKEQLTLYSDFISKHNSNLLFYYKQLIEIKEKLGLLSPLQRMRCTHRNELTISEKPQLLISDYVEAYTEESKKGNRVKAIIRNLEQEKIDYLFVNINVDGYLYKRHLLSITTEKWNSIFEMIPWIEKIDKIDPTEIFTDHRGERKRPLKYVEYKSASVQLMGRLFELFMPFDWANWKEGIEILAKQEFEGLDLITTCKLLTILLYYKEADEKQSSLGIACMAHDLEDGQVLKLLKQLKRNIENEHLPA